MRVERDYICFRTSKKVPIKMGWLEKKGEHLKLWRRRFLVLYDDGVFNGYKAAPSEEDIKTGSGTLENLFNVKSKPVPVRVPLTYKRFFRLPNYSSAKG